MHTYKVKRDVSHNGRIYREDDEVEMSERQARYLLISGAIEKRDTALRNDVPVDVSPKPKQKRTTVKKKSTRKHRNSDESE